MVKPHFSPGGTLLREMRDNPMRRRFLLFGLVLLVQAGSAVPAQQSGNLPGTAELTWDGDLSARMVAGIDRFLMRRLEAAPEERAALWERDFSSEADYARSVEANRERFRKIIGVVDRRSPVRLEFLSSEGAAPLAESDSVTVWRVRWDVLAGLGAEGLLVRPRNRAPIAQVIALPDADVTPRQLVGVQPGVRPEDRFALRLAESGCQVIVPELVDRGSRFSGNPALETGRPAMTNMPHREWLYRMAYPMGRHPIGYEVQKVLALVDWLESTSSPGTGIGVAGHAEGGLIALYAAAVDPRIDSCLVSGYFSARERIWQEPIYRNVWALLTEFGDAEIGSLVLPRTLVIEHSQAPRVEGPPPAGEGRKPVAAPGRIETPPAEWVISEFERLKRWAQALPAGAGTRVKLVPPDPRAGTVPPGSARALQGLLEPLAEGAVVAAARGAEPKRTGKAPDAVGQQRRLVRDIQRTLQDLLRISDRIRDQRYLERAGRESAESFTRESAGWRSTFWKEILGKIEDPMIAANPRSRRWRETGKWTGYEVVLDVWSDVFAWGILLVPKDLQPGERRPVVVAQHGLEGLPQDVVRTDGAGFRYYRAFASRLAEEGFIVFAPHNPYRGGDRFRVLQRKANPLKLSIFSFIIGQHRRILDWLKTLPWVDGERIGFYGLSYGGKTAMRVPAVLEDYALSICSGDFNQWIWKNVTVEWPNSYMFTGEYEMPEFGLGTSFNYAEMAYLIFPRPFMVERGHGDEVGLDEWVAHEYAKVRRLYRELGQGSRTEIEWFAGEHQIHGEGTFRFLRKHLDWKQPR